LGEHQLDKLDEPGKWGHSRYTIGFFKPTPSWAMHLLRPHHTGSGCHGLPRLPEPLGAREAGLAEMTDVSGRRAEPQRA
jgi:hypothetical protein